MCIFHLPFYSEYSLTAYNRYAYLTGILGANKQEYLYNHFLNLVSTCDIRDLWCDYLLQKQWYTEEDLFEIVDINNQAIINMTRKEFIELVKNKLSDGYFVFGEFNEKYIDYSVCYEKIDRIHDFLLIGFDDEQDLFEVAAYNSKHRFDCQFINTEKIRYAIITAEERGNLKFLKLNKNYIEVVDLDQIKKNIISYLKGENNTNLNYQNCVFGINIMKKVIDFFNDIDSLDEINNSNFYHDLRFFHQLTDHKKILWKCICVLKEKGYRAGDFYENSNAVLDRYKMIYALFIKTNLSMQTKLNCHVLKLLRELALEAYNIESKYLNMVLM